MEVFEYKGVEVPSYHNPPVRMECMDNMQEEAHEYIETVNLEPHDITIDSIRREYSQLKESEVVRGDRNPFLVDLYKIEKSVSLLEQRFSQLLQHEEEEDPTKNIVLAVIQASKRDDLSYDAKTSMSDVILSSVKEDVQTLQESLQTIKGMICRLEEVSENHSLSSMLSHMENVSSILSPSFLRRMEIDYSVLGSKSLFCRAYSVSLSATQRSKQTPCLSTRVFTTQQRSFSLVSKKSMN